MKNAARVLVLILTLVAVFGPLRLGAAEPGALQCLRGGWTNDFTVCLSCHDGSLARNLTATAPNAIQANSHLNHPVPVSYLEAHARKPSEFVAPGALDGRLKLVNGEVQCVTCHTTTTEGNWRVVRVGGGRPLCISCHRR